MDTKFQKITVTGLLLTAFLAWIVISGCDGSSTSIIPDDSNQYRVEGFLVNDVTFASSYLSLNFLRNDTLLPTAEIIFNSDTLLYENDSYIFSDTAKDLLSPQLYSIDFSDGDSFSDGILTLMVDTFRISSINPDTTIPNVGGTSVQVEWTSTANVEGYILAVVLQDSAYSGSGYSEYVTSLATQATIPPDAFRMSNPNFPDTGWYNIYIYGYTGRPDSALSEKNIPVPLPSQLSDNISHEYLKGHMGSITITRKKSIHVVAL